MIFSDSDDRFLGSDTSVIGILRGRGIFVLLPNIKGVEVCTNSYYRYEKLAPFREAILNFFRFDTVTEIRMIPQGLVNFYIYASVYSRSEFISLLEKAYVVYSMESNT